MSQEGPHMPQEGELATSADRIIPSDPSEERGIFYIRMTSEASQSIIHDTHQCRCVPGPCEEGPVQMI